MPGDNMKDTERIYIDAIIYGVYAAIIPMNMILNFSGAATVNKQLGIISAVAMIIMMLFQHRIRYIRNLNIGFLFFALYSLISIVWSIDGTQTYSSLITLVSLMLICLVGKMREFNSKEVYLISIMMILLAAAVPFFLGVNTAVSYSRRTLMNANGAADQNGLACNLAFVMILSLDKFFSTNKRIFKYLFAIATGLITIAIFLTGSRGALFSLGIAVVYYLIKTFPQIKRSRSFWGTVVLIVIAILVVFIYLDNNLSTAVLNRFSISSIWVDRGSGRLETWRNVIGILSDDPLRAIFGWGYGTQKSVYGSYYGYNAASHNAFLQIWMDVGIIGLVAYICGLMKLWKDAVKARSYISNALWIALFVTLMTLTFGTNKGAWNVILMMYLININTQGTACTPSMKQ